MTETGGHPWRERARPLRLERRVEFDEYEALREFLDKVAALSEETGLYPNLSFGRTYVNLTLFADEDGETLGREHEDFAQRVDDLLAGPAA
ncbi:4a-hydroxytetrahydrobiopterin dehydratase [Halochromatium glycolicum]|uniref:Pterin-4-alpha-carbinolamine dehydratase n=1 Tax=Halochromatium glycolicum TaxID=85075 RepID=A0AAJ0X9T2_9GAMM|nr:4a-hydroxytetrahydrobiopterin dehydratase [Halochromatium glycolicum]MBK1704568.1 pterin-4-alpha-carbinolamine dehydratase [Halochromatium glycolicum]